MRASRSSAFSLLATLLLTTGVVGCGGDETIEGDLGIEPLDDQTNVAEQGLISCDPKQAVGYRHGNRFDITVVTVDGRPVEIHTANAYYLMQQAAAKDGVALRVVSGFRTMAEQQYFYSCFINCNCNNCNLAAIPGTSNHQSGHALDLNTSEGRVYSWLSAHAAHFGFRRTVPSEIWHWEWWGGGPGGGPCGPNGDKVPYVERTEAALSAHSHDPAGSSDINGDGLADLCARNAQGVVCFLADGSGFGRRIDGPDLSNDRGWDKRSRHSTIRLADIDADGKSDLCARSGEGFKCWRSNGEGFGPPIVTSFMSDDQGWDAPSQYSTIRMADIDGDGDADVCGRNKSVFRCFKSLGDRFGGAIDGPEWSNDKGWDDVSHYGSIRMGDVDGDGKDDVCGRNGNTIVCFKSTGDGFGRKIDGPDWSNKVWSDAEHWSTIELSDVNGDGQADVCGRGEENFKCHLSRGLEFGPKILGPTLGKVWDDHAYYATLRLADIDGDGDRDICGRSASGLKCWRFRDGGFGDHAIRTTLLTDAGEWDKPRYYRSIRFADIDGDGDSDLCARSAAGVRCWRSLGDSFGPRILGPEWSDRGGWDKEIFGTTIRLQ